MQYGISFNTRRPVDEIEDWLETHCRGPWTIRLDGVLNAGRIDRQLQLGVLFEDAQDRYRFQQHFASW